ncbi:MAG: TonB-dependent receptor [Colwellia sp.]
MKPSITYLLPLSFIFTNLAQATEQTTTADSGYHDHNTEVIVVTGTRTPKLLSNSPVSVTVISQKEVELLTSGTIAQTLNYLPGVVVVRNQKDGYNIQMQGFSGDNVLVLLNGQPLISPTGSAVDLDQINAQDIVQIEVIKGAASVMYGSSAMGGVINILTKQPDENQAKLSYEIGSYVGNTIADDELVHQVRLNSTFVTQGWANQLNLLFKSTPGFDYDDDHNSTPVGSLDKTFVNLATRGILFQLNTEIKYQYLDEKKDKNTGIIAGQMTNQTYISDVNQHQLDFHLGKDVFDKKSHTVANTSWHMNARLMQHNETSGKSGSLRDAEIGLYELNGQYVWSPAKTLELVSGGVIHQDTLEQIKQEGGTEEVPYTTKESVEAFTQANWKYQNHQFLLGIRAQNDSDFGNHSAVRASGMVNFPLEGKTLQWRYGIGQGYRVPTLKERFYKFDHSALGYKVYGNPDLAPEESVSLNSTINYQQDFDTFNLTGEINLHYTQADNLIDLFKDSEQSELEDLDISVYGNIDEATISGVDLTAALEFNQFSAQLNYSYLDAQDQDGERLQSRPYHQVKGNLAYNHATLDLDAVLYFVYQNNEMVPESQYPNGSLNNEWVTVDFKVSQNISEHFSWRFGVENIFDVHRSATVDSEQVFDARPTSSRYVYVGLSYQL